VVGDHQEGGAEGEVRPSHVIPRRAKGANPESITATVSMFAWLCFIAMMMVMDSGLADTRRPGMTLR
jgi:hypothetical protein